MKGLGIAVSLAAAAAVAWPATGGATNECNGLRVCIPVSGPWVVVTGRAEARWLLSCPSGRGIVGGLDAAATSRAVRVEFAGRLSAPVAPGTTTTRNALFLATLAGGGLQAFQPHIGCIPVGGGGGRSTVSARQVVPPGPAPERVSQTVAARPGRLAFAAATCRAGETQTGSWASLAFKTAQPPSLQLAGLVHLRMVVRGARAGVTVVASDALPPGAHAVVQVGVECAP